MAIDFKGWFSQNWFGTALTQAKTNWSNLSSTQKWTFGGALGLGGFFVGYKWYKKSPENTSNIKIETQFRKDTARTHEKFRDLLITGKLKKVKKCVDKTYSNGFALNVEVIEANKVSILTKYWKDENNKPLGLMWRDLVMCFAENGTVREDVEEIDESKLEYE